MRRVGAALGLGVLLGASTASAYCRTTTCDVNMSDPTCLWDADGCATSGQALFWPSSCTWFGVQKDGSPKRHISYQTAHDTIAGAFAKWGAADCGGGAVPSFAVQDTDVLYGPIECAQHEFNRSAANANVWLFRDDTWPYIGATTTIALTTLSVEIKTGRILDADVEINSYGMNITTSDVDVVADFESIVTHESGHFLGLAHSADSLATMFASYSPANVAVRTLSPDDEAAICAAYPPAAAPFCGQPEPLYGFSRHCGGINPDTSAEMGSGGAGGASGAPSMTSSDAGAMADAHGEPSLGAGGVAGASTDASKPPLGAGAAAGARGASVTGGAPAASTSDASLDSGNDSRARASSDSAGCSCNVGASPVAARALTALLLAVAALGRRRRLPPRTNDRLGLRR